MSRKFSSLTKIEKSAIVARYERHTLMAFAYIVYGIPFAVGPNSANELRWLLDTVVPDLTKRHGSEVWKNFDTNTHAGDYYLLKFQSKLVLCCWWTEHSVTDVKNAVLLDMPTKDTKENFANWCVNRDIDVEDVGFYILASTQPL